MVTKRIRHSKVFKALVITGKSIISWFRGFHFHIVINDNGEILSFCVTQTNVDDRELPKNVNFIKQIFGKLFVSRRYISEKLHQLFFVDGTPLITNI